MSPPLLASIEPGSMLSLSPMRNSNSTVTVEGDRSFVDAHDYFISKGMTATYTAPPSIGTKEIIGPDQAMACVVIQASGDGKDDSLQIYDKKKAPPSLGQKESNELAPSQSSDDGTGDGDRLLQNERTINGINRRDSLGDDTERPTTPKMKLKHFRKPGKRAVASHQLPPPPQAMVMAMHPTMTMGGGTFDPNAFFCGACVVTNDQDVTGLGSDAASKEAQAATVTTMEEIRRTKDLGGGGSTIQMRDLYPQIGAQSKNINTPRLDPKEAVEALVKSGFAARGLPSSQSRLARSQFAVQGVCCASEVPAVRKIVKPIPGVGKIQINLTTKDVYVEHDPEIVSAEFIAETLTLKGFPSAVQKDGATALRARDDDGNDDEKIAAVYDAIRHSKYVESTLAVLDGDCHASSPGHLLADAGRIVKKSFIRKQVRAIYPHIASHTIKVEHDPKLISAQDVADLLSRQKVPVKVSIDGATANMFLPEQPVCIDDNRDVEAGNGLFQIHLNVVMSGCFWFISMLSFVGGRWESLKYAGLLSVLCGLPPICVKAWRTLRRQEFDANCMMVLAAVGALALQEYDEAASVSFLFAVSEYLETRATLRARKALSAICELRPDHANVIHPLTNEVVIVPADQVPLGALVSVKTGDKIVADGVVVEGSSMVDESSLTGESKPAQKESGDLVSGGTINIGDTQLVVKTTTTVEDSAVSRLIRLVEEAQANVSPTEKMIDAFARSYTPSVVLVAFAMCTIPWFWGAEAGRYWMLNGLIVIVIACPCALTISTPVTYAAGLAATAQRGIIVKGGAKLEAMGNVRKIVFDKTGTLTEGKFSVEHLDQIGSSKTRREMLDLMVTLQDRSSHPLSVALVTAARNEGARTSSNMKIEGHRILVGEGVTAMIDGTNAFAGNIRLFKRLGMYARLSTESKELLRSWERAGGTIGCIGLDEIGIIGIYCVKDTVRKEARSAIRELANISVEPMMCTGDSSAAAMAVATEIGLPTSSVNSQLLPEDKLHFVGSLKRPSPTTFSFCRAKHYVLFCGDGVNDAPALAVADVGVSMGEGAAMAMEMSDVTLMDCNLSKLTYTIRMGRRVVQTIRENIAISLIAKLAVISLAFFGKMSLLMAIASDVGVMLAVTLNGMKLLSSKATEESWIAQVLKYKAHRSGQYTSVAPEEGSDSTAEIEIV